MKPVLDIDRHGGEAAGASGPFVPGYDGTHLVLPAVNTVVIRRREPSRPRTQGGPIFEDIGPTEDDGMRSVRSRGKRDRICGGEHSASERHFETAARGRS